MLWKRKRKWHRFDKGLIAVSAEEAQFLKQWYMEQVSASAIAGNFELLDLQRYKKVTVKAKVQAALYSPDTVPFAFFACLN